MAWLIAISALWLACGVLTYGITFAYFNTKYPGNAREDHGVATFFALGGPFGLLVATLSSGFAEHGIRYRERPRS